MAIPTGITPTGTLDISSNGVKDVTNYANVNVNVPASAVTSGTYTYPSGSTGGTVDITQYKSVNASNVYAKGKADGDVKHTISIYGDGHSGDWNSIIIKEGSTELARGSCSSTRAYNITI